MATLEIDQPQCMAALKAANEGRVRIAEIKRDLRSGRLSLPDLMAEPPAEIAAMLLIDVIRLVQSRSAGGRLAVVGRRALADQVNLMVPLGRASARTRGWVAEHGLYHAHAGRPS